MAKYIVGLRREKKNQSLIVEDDDALLAAVRAQHEYPDATITMCASPTGVAITGIRTRRWRTAPGTLVDRVVHR